MRNGFLASNAEDSVSLYYSSPRRGSENSSERVVYLRSGSQWPVPESMSEQAVCPCFGLLS